MKAQTAILTGLVSAKLAGMDDQLAAVRDALAHRGIRVVGTFVQKRGVSRSKSPGGAKRLDAPLNAATVIGPGKVQELRSLVDRLQVNAVYFLNPLSSSQVERLSTLIDCPVVSISTLGMPAVL
ncbi:MAG TPA: hypothetical protein VMU50_13650 [Polyangia bacterium]|nr:hypothetical protein [Polyangia bacterium]